MPRQKNLNQGIDFRAGMVYDSLKVKQLFNHFRKGPL